MAERQKAVAPMRKRLQAELAGAAKRHVEARSAIADQALRPRRPAFGKPVPKEEPS